mgnify:CR=1 FL=1
MGENPIICLIISLNGIFRPKYFVTQNCELSKTDNSAKIKTIAETEPKVKAIGEIGIDYYYDDSAPRESQLNCFQNQILIAKELDLPIIVHDRQSKGDTLKVLKDMNVTKGVIHCFSGSAETAKILINMGFMISFTGVITFKNAKRAIEALKVIPIERLMIDSCAYRENLLRIKRL